MSSYSNYHRLPAATTNQAFEPGPHLHAAAKQHWPRQVHLSIPRAKTGTSGGDGPKIDIGTTQDGDV